MRTVKNLVSMFVFGLVLAQGIFPGTTAAAATHASSAHHGGPFGLGIAIGDPTAITGKYWLDNRQAADVGVSYWLSRYFLVYSDYDFHFPGVFGSHPAFIRDLAPYIGIGGMLVFATGSDRNNRGDRYFADNSSAAFALGMRIPFGLEWRPSEAPLGVFVELAPGLTLIPGTSSFFQGDIGIRYYF